MIPALGRLARYGVASVFGGLPLYVPAPLDTPVAIATSLRAVVIVVRIACWCPPNPRWPLPLAALAQPPGLLALGLVFDNTPIELRYLTFALPFAMIALAGGLSGFPRLAALTLATQAVSIVGLALAPATMQPARQAAAEVARLAEPGTVILLPRGDDGVGVPGAFTLYTRPDARLLLVHPDDTVATIDTRPGDTRHVMIVALTQDGASRAITPTLKHLAAGWERIGTGSWASAYRRVSAPERSETDPYPPDPPRTS